MKTGLRKNLGLPKNWPCDTYTWLDHMNHQEARIMPYLPCIYLKCTSMIMDTRNFSINYSSPFIPSICKSSCNISLSEKVLELSSPSSQQKTISGSDQVSQSSYRVQRKTSQKSCKHSNVRVTMQYLGTGFSVTNEIINPKDELRMFQQICGGENICVYKGYLSPGEMFQFTSKRHYGFPFSASIYINGLIAARISSCCEYRYHVGFQQGRRGCFRVAQLSGGKPCYRCIEFHQPRQCQIKGKDNSIGSESDESGNREENVLSAKRILDWALQSDFLSPGYPEKKKEDTEINERNTERIHTESTHCQPKENTLLLCAQRKLRAIQVCTANQRKRLKKRRTAKEESDSEQENILCNKEQRHRKLKALQSKMRDDSKNSKTPSSLGQFTENSDSKYDNISGNMADALSDYGKSKAAQGHLVADKDNDITEQTCKCPEDRDCIEGNLNRPEMETNLHKTVPPRKTIHEKLAMALTQGNIPYSEVELSDSSDSSENRSIAELKLKTEETAKNIADEAETLLPVTDLQEAERTSLSEEKAQTSLTVTGSQDTQTSRSGGTTQTPLPVSVRQAAQISLSGEKPQMSLLVTNLQEPAQSSRSKVKAQTTLPVIAPKEPPQSSRSEEKAQPSLPVTNLQEAAQSSRSVSVSVSLPVTIPQDATQSSRSEEKVPISLPVTIPQDAAQSSRSEEKVPISLPVTIPQDAAQSSRSEAKVPISLQVTIPQDATQSSRSEEKVPISLPVTIPQDAAQSSRSEETVPISLQVTILQEAAQSSRSEEKVKETRACENGLEIPEGLEDEDDGDSLLNQITDLITVLQECDEVDHLVLRNTGMTDILLRRLTAALIESKSEVEEINLNLNELGPDGAQSIVQLLKAKPCIKSLLLYGNQFGNEGIKTIMSTLTDLHIIYKDPSISHSGLIELDIGGNQLTAEGLQAVAAFLRLNPPLKYLGLAQSTTSGPDTWMELFDALKVNTNINHLLLDDNRLGDEGARFLANAISVNKSIVTLDLDNNDVGEEGGRAIAERLTFSAGSVLRSISLDGNHISTETMENIQKMLTLNISL